MISQSTRNKLEQSVELSVSSAETGLEYVRGYVAEWLAAFATDGEKVEALREINLLLEIVQRRVESLSETTATIATSKLRELTREDARVGDLVRVLVRRKLGSGNSVWSGAIESWTKDSLVLKIGNDKCATHPEFETERVKHVWLDQ